MKYSKLFLLFLIHCAILQVGAQNLPEDMKVALVYKIANQVKWGSDASTYFTIGILSDNEALIKKFHELSGIAEIDGKKIKISTFSNVKSIQPTQILYIDPSYNSSFFLIFKKIDRQKTLLISEEYDQPGEIMINLKLDIKKGQLTFEYNRANILFQGLDLSEQIVLLKGTEIEIRELYLSAKKLWDNQKAEVELLKIQSNIQNKSLNIQKDSIFLMKKNILENKKTIDGQIRLITQKDSISNFLNLEIKNQQNEIANNRSQINLFIKDRSSYEALISKHKQTIFFQKKLSDSLAKDIIFKEKELDERIKALNEKEILIQKQYYGLLISFLIIAVVIISIFFIFRSYVVVKRAKQKIADQKEELEVALEQLKSAQQQLIHSEKMASLGVLVAGIAHEINNPINFISSGIDGIESVMEQMVLIMQELNKFYSSDDTEIKKMLHFKDQLKFEDTIKMMPEVIENIKMGVRRTIEITNGLRLFSHIDKEEKSLYNINQIIDSAILLTKPQITNRIEIQTNYQTLPTIMVLPGKLSQVFVNIISNSIDSILESQKRNSTDEKSTISITSKILNNNVIIEFSDTGTGIPAGDLDRLFDPFYTTKKVGKGTGLGLSITLGIIEEHNGRIFARNNLTQGATFVVELPIEN